MLSQVLFGQDGYARAERGQEILPASEAAPNHQSQMDYLALFVSAFLAATLLPLASEAPLALVVRARGDLVLPVVVASVGNVIGACTTYALARGVIRWGGDQSDAFERRRAVALVRRYGAPALLLSWVPVIGDGIVLVAGAARLPFPRFLAFATAGKVLRYVAVAWLVRGG
jgi:membrane protein YqaA with SNARE-associated domain